VLDHAVTGGAAGGTPGHRGHRRCDGAPHAQKHVLKPWQQEAWCLPRVSAECVWRMEDILDLDAEPYAPLYPLVCCDASPYQRVSDVRQP
jgi:hypothetical protein